MLFASKPALATCFNSRLIADLFSEKRVPQGKRLRVLDFGCANGDTITFLGQFNTYVYVADIAQHFKLLNAQLKPINDIEDMALEKANIRKAIIKVLNLQADDIFDVCLFWDVFNYMAPHVLPLFADVLAPHLSPNFAGHGFAVLNKNTVLIEQNYGIINTELLSVYSPSKAPLPYPHSQSAIKNYLPGIISRQSVLREDGRLEMILCKDDL